jgi:hypothetical protein
VLEIKCGRLILSIDAFSLWGKTIHSWADLKGITGGEVGSGDDRISLGPWVFNSENGQLQISNGQIPALRVKNTSGLLDFYFYGVIHANEPAPVIPPKNENSIQIGDWVFSCGATGDLDIGYGINRPALKIELNDTGIDFYFYGVIHADEPR